MGFLFVGIAQKLILSLDFIAMLYKIIARGLFLFHKYGMIITNKKRRNFCEKIIVKFVSVSFDSGWRCDLFCI